MFPYTHISTPKVQNCENVSWLSGFLLLSFSSMGKMWFNRSKTSTHSHPEEEIERGHEEEREGSPVSIFPPPKIQNFENVSWLSGFLLSSLSSMGENVVQQV